MVERYVPQLKKNVKVLKEGLHLTALVWEGAGWSKAFLIQVNH